MSIVTRNPNHQRCLTRQSRTNGEGKNKGTIITRKLFSLNQAVIHEVFILLNEHKMATFFLLYSTSGISLQSKRNSIMIKLNFLLHFFPILYGIGAFYIISSVDVCKHDYFTPNGIRRSNDEKHSFSFFIDYLSLLLSFCQKVVRS